MDDHLEVVVHHQVSVHPEDIHREAPSDQAGLPIDQQEQHHVPLQQYHHQQNHQVHSIRVGLALDKVRHLLVVEALDLHLPLVWHSVQAPQLPIKQLEVFLGIITDRLADKDMVLSKCLFLRMFPVRHP